MFSRHIYDTPQRRSQGLSSCPRSGKKRDPGNNVTMVISLPGGTLRDDTNNNNNSNNNNNNNNIIIIIREIILL